MSPWCTTVTLKPLHWVKTAILEIIALFAPLLEHFENGHVSAKIDVWTAFGFGECVVSLRKALASGISWHFLSQNLYLDFLFLLPIIIRFRFLVEAVTFLEPHLKTEGLFRKSGSLARQKTIRVSSQNLMSVQLGKCLLILCSLLVWQRAKRDRSL